MVTVSKIGAASAGLLRKHALSPAQISLVVIALGIGGLFGVQHIITQEKQPTTLPQALVSKIQSFTPYYFSGRIPDGFTLKPASVKFENDILLFQIVDATNRQTITVSQQALPTTLANETYPKAEKVQGVDGYAVIVYNKTQTSGSLFSSPHDNRKTMVLLNTYDPVKKDTLAELLRSLRPLKY
jgi:hypothetical protein